MTTADSQRSAAIQALGLPAHATPEEVAAAREQLVAFLDQAPSELDGWAQRQRRLAERAVGDDAQIDEDLELSGLEDQAPVAAVPAVSAAPKRRNRLVTGLGLATLGAAVVLGVYLLDDGGQPQQATSEASSPADGQQMSTPKPVDPKMVATLEEKIKKDPKDVLSMKALGQIYDGAQEYKKAAQWQARVTKVTPKDSDAWTALGVAHFNDANLDEAEKAWNQAAKLDPKKAVIHYNLGFLHMSRNDMDKAKAAWQKVVELEPDSDLAKTVQSHLGGPSSTPAAKSSTTPAASAPTTPNASSAPSGSATPPR
ncbi:tetratricopeptide repeat protein [Luteococcus sp. OSA5]|uniref:tetratricopeptide repeat protein n=1 Tax=Luteococcus sp. OSA5 TaxID=3401630 RepID=UPI003B4294EE